MRMEDADIRRGHRGRRLTYEDAMGNDLVNAVIELVTNADDSYLAMEDRGELHEQVSIRIEIERRRPPNKTVLAVKDRAEGMTREDMREKLQVEGELHRRFGTENRKRGMFGSGAKEVTHFGRTVFESISGDQYTRYEIPQGGGSQTAVPRIGSESPDRHREEMGIPHGNGTVVTIYVDSAQFTIPRYETLKRRLQTAPQLQPILQDERRRLQLVDLNHPEENSEQILYFEPDAEIVIEDRELVVPRFQEAIEASGQPPLLTLKRASEPAGEFAGVLIQAGRTAFERDQLGLTNQPYADRFFGELDCRFLWRLIAEAEARDAEDPTVLPAGEEDEFLVERPLNPSRPVSRRRRSGLDRTHPFISALREQITEILNGERQRALSELAGDDRPEMDERLERELSEIPDRLADLLAGEEGDDESERLRLVPGSLNVEVGEIDSFSVYADPELAEASGEHVEVVPIEGEDRIEVDANERPLSEAEDRFSASFRIRGVEEGNAVLLVGVGRETRQLDVTIGSEDEESVELIAFDRNQYSVRADGSRSANVTVAVSPELREQVGGDRVALSLGGAEGISEAVQLTAPNPTIRRDGDEPFLAKSKLLGGRGGAGLTGRLSASYGHASVSARVRITTAEEDERTGELPFEIEYRTGIEAEKRRYNWDEREEGEVLEILADHPSVDPFYSEQDGTVMHKPELVLVTKEIAAGAVAYRGLSEEIEDQGTDDGAIPLEILSEYERRVEEALRRIYS